MKNLITLNKVCINFSHAVLFKTIYSKTSFQFILRKWHCCSSGSSLFSFVFTYKKNVIGLKQNPEAACSPEEVSV